MKLDGGYPEAEKKRALLCFDDSEDQKVDQMCIRDSLYPAFVALINYVFYKEHLAKSTVLVLLAATLGIFFFFEPGNGNSSIGILLAIASSISYAFYMTGVERRRLNQLNSYKLTFYLALIACFVMFFYNLVLNKMVWQLPLAAYGYAFLIGFGCSFFAVFPLQLGIKYLGASTAAIFLSLIHI